MELQLDSERGIEAGIHSQELAGFRVGPQTSAAIDCIAMTPAHERPRRVSGEERRVTKARYAEHARDNVGHALADHLAALGLHAVSKIGEQERNARIVQAVEREWNHFFGARAGCARRHGAIVQIEVTELRVA